MPLTLYPSQQPYVPANVAVSYKGLETAGGGPDVHSQTSSNDGSSGSEQRRGYIFFSFSFSLSLSLSLRKIICGSIAYLHM